ncbi:MAG: nucleoside recognition domain-containing protein [Oscillospiraceae bacterium]
MRIFADKRKIFDILICIGLFSIMAALVLYPGESVSAAHDGITLCGNVIIPSLFPFFVLSTLVIELGLAERFGHLLEPVMRPLFNVGGAASAAFVLGFIGGYPIGAKAVITLYKNGSISKSEAERLLAFCNNSGPSFILGVVGAGVFSSGKVGFLLYAAHVTASICIGITFRKWGGKSATYTHAAKRTPQKYPGFTNAFIESVKSSFQSTLNICGFVIFFCVFIKLLYLAGVIPALSHFLGHVFSPFGFDEEWAERLLTGFIELSSGVWTLQGAAGKLGSRMAMAAFMLGWAGLSIHCQVLSFIAGSGISARTYIFGKFLHGSLSAAFVMILSRLVSFDAPVSAYLAEQVTGIASMGFTTALTVSMTSALTLWLIILAAAFFSSKNTGNIK